MPSASGATSAPIDAGVPAAGGAVVQKWSDRDVKFMRLALDVARSASERDEVQVGCVFVDSRTDTVIASTHNETNQTRNATRHCEMVAIDRILSGKDPAGGKAVPKTATASADRSIFRHCELYVTVEPCIMCAAALRLVGINRVVYGCANTRFGGTGSVLDLHKPRNGVRGYESMGGLFAEESIRLLKDFYQKGNPHAPNPKRRRGDAGFSQDGKAIMASPTTQKVRK